MTELPRGWAWATLGELGDELRQSVTPKANVEYELYSVPAFSTGSPEIVMGSAIGSAKRAVVPGDVLLCKINPRINRVWIVSEWHGRQQIASPEYLILRTSEPDVARYLRWYLSAPAFRDWVTLSVEGATGSHTRAKTGPILRQAVPLPPLAEQRRIVAAIEEQLSHVQAASSILQRTKARLARLRETALGEVFTGSPLARLEDVAQVVSGQTPKGLHPLTSGPIPFYKVGDMNVASSFAMAESRTYLSDELVLRHGVHVRPEGTVIFPKRGGAIATNKKRILARPAAFDLNTMGVVPGPRLLPKYLLLWFETIDLSSISDGSNVPQINHDDIAQLRLPLPSLREQERLVMQSEASLSRIDSLHSAVVAAIKRSDALRRAILARAFRGELVPQAPNDEPASVLLERIADERATAGAGKGTRQPRRATIQSS